MVAWNVDLQTHQNQVYSLGHVSILRQFSRGFLVLHTVTKLQKKFSPIIILIFESKRKKIIGILGSTIFWNLEQTGALSMYGAKKHLFDLEWLEEFWSKSVLKWLKLNLTTFFQFWHRMDWPAGQVLMYFSTGKR